MKIRNAFLKIKKRTKGVYLPVIMLTSTLFIAFAVAVISFAISDLKMSKLQDRKSVV